MRKPGESVYCLSFWRDKFKGKSGDEPYFDVAEDGISAGKVMRIYVDAKRFPTWQKWKDEADKARACAYIGNASMCGYFVKGGTSYPLSASPAFMIERPELPGLDTILWINVLCPNESEFHWAVEEAKKKRPNSRRRTRLPANSMRRSTMSSIDTGRPQRAILTHFSGGTGSRLQRQRMTAHMTEHTGERFTGLSRMISKALLKKIGLGASECGNTLGELFQKWRIPVMWRFSHHRSRKLAIKKQPVKIGGIPIYPYLLHDRITFMSALPAIALLRHIKRTNAPILQIFFRDGLCLRRFRPTGNWPFPKFGSDAAGRYAHRRRRTGRPAYAAR